MSDHVADFFNAELRAAARHGTMPTADEVKAYADARYEALTAPVSDTELSEWGSADGGARMLPPSGPPSMGDLIRHERNRRNRVQAEDQR